MKKFYILLSTILFGGLISVSAQDSTVCNAGFQAIPSGYQVVFFPADSLPGVVHRWNFGDSSQKVTDSSIIFHQFAGSGTFLVTQIVIDSARHCQQSASQYVTIFANPTASCGVSISLNSDSSRHRYTFIANTSFTPGVADTVTWTINDTLAGHGDTLQKYLITGPVTICAYLSTGDGCRSQSCITIDPRDSVPFPPPPPPDTCTIAFTATPAANRPNQYMFSVINGAEYDSIIWSIQSPDSMPTRFYQGPDITYTFPDTGLYTVIVSADRISGCPVQSGQWVHIDSLGSPSDQSITSYPNPATTRVTLTVTLTKYETVDIRVYNSMGGMVSSRNFPGYPGVDQLTIPVGNLPTGVYYIELQIGNTILRSKFQKL
jgi:hypothetical protein